MKATVWKAHGDHSEVHPFPGAVDTPGWDCPVSDCDALLTEHGVAHVGPDDHPLMVHPGDRIDGTGAGLAVVSHGMRYDGVFNAKAG